MGDGSVDDDRTVVSCFAAPLGNPDPNSIGVETWVVAEDAAREVLSCIHPTLDSDEKRKYVIEYVQKLIRCNLGFEIFPYGSVPLRTYLPDGDIDLTVLSIPNLEERLPSEVLRVLLEEEKHGNSEYELRDTQFIDAEVKLVKCIVQDIVIDISFNQLGGLSTLCFLEQVDRLAGKDHLYKRSLILIKAWCYYESRILGAHHGLISTYALEILVLYIFQIFHASLNGPLEVLYRFLDYYAKFDWDNYCISLDGPVCKSSFPGLAGMKYLYENGSNGLLLEK
ncbi:putative polynucleotide adenylyltransferase [Helianthus anomalus]